MTEVFTVLFVLIVFVFATLLTVCAAAYSFVMVARWIQGISW